MTIPSTFRSHKVYDSAEVVCQWHGVITDAALPGIGIGAPCRVTCYRGYASQGYRSDYQRRPAMWIEASVRLATGKIRCEVRRLTGQDQEANGARFFAAEVRTMAKFATSAEQAVQS